jgi:hypothetical protein
MTRITHFHTMIDWMYHTVAAYGLTVSFRTNCAQMQRQLATYIWPWLPRDTQPAENPDLVFTIAAENSTYRFFLGPTEVACVAAVHDALNLAQNCLDEQFTSRAKDVIPLHAGAVAFGNAGVVLPGQSHYGKSTLVYEFLKLGGAYYSDEYALLDDQGLLHPYPRALMLRNGSGEVHATLAPEMDRHRVPPPVNVAYILAIRYQPGAVFEVEATDQSSMVITLLKNTPRAIGASSKVFAPIALAVSRAHCFVGIRGSARDAALRIRELVARFQ